MPSLRAGGWTRRVAEGLQIIAAGAAQRGDRPSARRCLEEALDHCHRVTDLWGAAKVRVELARLEADGSDAAAAQIANHLTIGTRTAESHVAHLLAKLGFVTRTQIAVWATAEDRVGGTSP